MKMSLLVSINKNNIFFYKHSAASFPILEPPRGWFHSIRRISPYSPTKSCSFQHVLTTCELIVDLMQSTCSPNPTLTACPILQCPLFACGCKGWWRVLRSNGSIRWRPAARCTLFFGWSINQLHCYATQVWHRTVHRNLPQVRCVELDLLLCPIELFLYSTFCTVLFFQSCLPDWLHVCAVTCQCREFRRLAFPLL